MPGAPSASLAAEPTQLAAMFAATRFVLVEPSHPGNVGAAARALKTMGFGRLVLVNPRLPAVAESPEAIAMASGAQDVLAQSEVAASLEQALSGVHWSLAMTARSREYGPPLLQPRQAACEALAKLRATVPPGGSQGAPQIDHSLQLAVVFGNERVGLSNFDVERCSARVSIPANPDYSSLNLAQAVQVLAYELRVTFQTAQPVPSAVSSRQALAANNEIEAMFEHLESALVALEFLDPGHPKKLMSRLRRLFGRTALETEEVNIVRGIAKHILARIPLRNNIDQASSDSDNRK